MSDTFALLLQPPYIYIFVVLISLAIGSFLNVVILRYPQMLEKLWHAEAEAFLKETTFEPPALELTLSKPGSHCPQCKNALRFWHNIPLISFLALRGRCAFCKTRISWRYPLIEALTLLITIIVVQKYGISIYSLGVVLLSWVMIVQSGIDVDHQFIPDVLSYSMLWLGLLLSAFNISSLTPLASILGATVGYLALWIIAKAFYLLRKKQGMGHGDFKLLAMIGAWTGPSLLPFVLIIACFSSLLISAALLLRKKMNASTPIPFGPFLVVGGWLCLLFGNTLLLLFYTSTLL